MTMKKVDSKKKQQGHNLSRRETKEGNASSGAEADDEEAAAELTGAPDNDGN
jgi:hypothetical protein